MTLVVFLVAVVLLALLCLLALVEYRRICRRDAQHHATSTDHAGRPRL